MWGLNAFSAAGYVWGRDLIFSYGPLGYLARPLDVGNNIVAATAAFFIVHVATFATVALTLIRRRRPVPVVIFLACYPVLVAFDLEFDYQVLAAAGLLAAAALELGIAPLLAAAAVVASPLIFIKFGTGLAAAGMLAAACVIWVWRRRSIAAAAFALTAYALAVAVMAWLIFRSFPAVGDFLKWSIALSRGYNDAMSLAGPTTVLFAAIVLSSTAATLGLFARNAQTGINGALLVFALPLAFSMKHSFLRADWEHMPFFFGLLWFVGAAALLFADTKRAQILWAALLVADAALFANVAAPREWTRRANMLVDVMTGRHARTRLAALVDLREVREAMRQTSLPSLSLTDRLPPEWIEEIGRRRVLIVPSELALCPANGLTCVPYPTLQMYATLTQSLDRWAASRLRTQPPDFAIVDLQAIDGRNMVWDCPETWLALVEGWEVVRVARGGQRVLLRQRETPARFSERALGSGSGHLGEWMDVPQSAGGVRLAIELRERPFGWLQRTLLRAAPVALTVRSAAGRTHSYRLVLDTARSGILLDASPPTSDLTTLLDCCAAADRARAFVIDRNAASAFEPAFGMTWSEVLTVPVASARPPRPDRP